jgi:hypothetical protein
MEAGFYFLNVGGTFTLCACSGEHIYITFTVILISLFLALSSLHEILMVPGCGVKNTLSDGCASLKNLSLIYQ